MSVAIPKVWCADILVPVSPCAEAGDITAEGAEYPVKNALWDAASGTVFLSGAANEVVMFQLVIEGAGSTVRSLKFDKAGALETGLYQNIALPVQGGWHDDALVPVDLKDTAASIRRISEKAPEVAGRKRQTFLVEIYIPKKTKTAGKEFSLKINTAAGEVVLKINLEVFGFELPDKPTCTADINNYSRSPANGFEGALDDEKRYLNIERGFFRMARMHRAVMHLLPYSHSGRIEPGFAPKLEGRGKSRRVADWRPFDRHWGAYLDGSAFKGIHGGWDWPVEYLYTPINLNWPAYFENFGKPGYEVEYRNVFREIVAHFNQKKWTETNFEVFFNHKARWKYFPWDMDEIRFERDNYATEYFGRITNEIGAEFPKVRMINRIDSSWIFDKSARSVLADVIQLWVINRGYPQSGAPDEVALLQKKNRKIWFYGGSGPVKCANRLDNLHWPWITWGRGLDGFCWWNGIGQGNWNSPGWGGDHCFYPGARFGLDAPLASIRLKVLHRGMQDHAYLTILSKKTGGRGAADRIVGKTIGCRNREDWYQRKDEARDKARLSGADIQATSTSDKAWTRATVAAWNAARIELARKIESL